MPAFKFRFPKTWLARIHDVKLAPFCRAKKILDMEGMLSWAVFYLQKSIQNYRYECHNTQKHHSGLNVQPLNISPILTVNTGNKIIPCFIPVSHPITIRDSIVQRSSNSFSCNFNCSRKLVSLEIRPSFCKSPLITIFFLKNIRDKYTDTT